MDIKHLNAKLKEIENRKNVSIFESIGRGDQYFTRWERDIDQTLCEVALHPEQIQQLFILTGLPLMLLMYQAQF